MSSRAALSALGGFVVSFIGYAIVTGSIEASAAVHATAGAALLAFAGVAAACRAVFADVLDQAAAMVLIAGGLLLGVFALGDIAASLPTPLLNLLLLANPIVGVASAAGIDIFHGARLYALSPIAHREFQYPAWQFAAALYGCIAIASFLAARLPIARRAAGTPAPTH